MEDESGTDGFDDVTPAPAGQAETTTDDTAANAQTETQPDTSTDAETTTEDLTDEDLAWAQKKGVNLEDKKAVAKMLRNADQKVAEAGKAKTTLQTAVDETNAGNPDDDVVTALQLQNRQLEGRFNALNYYIENPDDKQYDEEATGILKETLETDPELARGLGRNLPALFALAKARHADAEVAKAKDEGRKEERKALAGKQRASATSQAATTSAPTSEDHFLKGFDNPY